MKKRLILGVIIIILLVSCGFYFYKNNKNLNNLRNELETAVNTILTRDTQIDNLSKENIYLQEQIVNFQKQIDEKDKVISGISDNLSLFENQLHQYKNNADNTRLQLKSFSLDIEKARAKIKITAETLGEVDSGVNPEGLIENGRFLIPGRAFKLIRNENALDPSWAELEDFLKRDQTDKKIYIENEYTCGNFAEEVFNNAQKEGIRTAIVTLNFDNETQGHALNAFKTTDCGLVYIDCTGDIVPSGESMDSEAFINLGQVYQRELIFSNGYYESEGVIKTLNIYW